MREMPRPKQSAGRIHRVFRVGARHPGRFQRGLDDGQHSADGRHVRHQSDSNDAGQRRSHPARPDAGAPGDAVTFTCAVTIADHMNRPAYKPQRSSAAGFTLIEILVALLILGIMSALGYGTYRAARISAERTEESLKRSREIEFGMR